jgi:hypothetical protein
MLRRPALAHYGISAWGVECSQNESAVVYTDLITRCNSRHSPPPILFVMYVFESQPRDRLFTIVIRSFRVVGCYISNVKLCLCLSIVLTTPRTRKKWMAL